MNLLGLEEILCCIQEETVSLFPEKNFPRTDHFTKFCGFFMKNKDLECEKIGFQVEKLNKACTKKVIRKEFQFLFYFHFNPIQ